MGLEFLRANGVHRMRDDALRPLLLDNDTTGGGEMEEQEQVEMGYEKPVGQWKPIDTKNASIPANWAHCPKLFIDGKDVGRTVAWLQTVEGFPIPVRLSEIGAVMMCNNDRHLQREWHIVEQVVAMIVDPFPWDEVESFAAALQEKGFRLLPCQKPKGRLTYDFQEMRKATQNRSMDEMMRLEKQALVHAGQTPVLVDGRLDPRKGGFDETRTPVVGMIKGHYQSYLHDEGWRTYYDLQSGQRTPAFLLGQKNIKVVSWYLRLDGTPGNLPSWGIVRLEIPEKFFSQQVQCDWSYINRLSRMVCEYRCKDKSYERASVSLYPIQRAEEILGATMTGGDAFIHRFYNLTQL
ncbi:MAG: hypothetical protein ACYDER_03260 [Ktedonobacteraceae bacterium]